MRPDVIRVVFADDHTFVRAGLRAVLGLAPDIEVIGEAEDGRQAVSLVEQLQPNVAIMDLDMQGLDGTAATRLLVSKGFQTRILVLTMHTEEARLTSALEAGASGFLVKSVADRELIDAVRTVAYGDVYVRPVATHLMVTKLVQIKGAASDRQRFAGLSEREQAVLRLIARGYSAPEIGGRLSISPKTVETYKQRIHEKLGLSHRTEYVQFAVRLGLFEEELPGSAAPVAGVTTPIGRQPRTGSNSSYGVRELW